MLALDFDPRLAAFFPVFSPGARIAAAAWRFAKSPVVAASCARAARFRSVNPAMSDDYRGRAKDAALAGDVLYAAGFAAPLERGRYADAGRWPLRLDLFAPAQAPRAGDLLVVCGRVEVVVAASGGRLQVVTARAHGLAVERRAPAAAAVVLRPRPDAV